MEIFTTLLPAPKEAMFTAIDGHHAPLPALCGTFAVRAGMFVKRVSGSTVPTVHASWEGLEPDDAQCCCEESNSGQQTGFTDRERPVPIPTG